MASKKLFFLLVSFILLTITIISLYRYLLVIKRTVYQLFIIVSKADRHKIYKINK